ncbi:unnamed protein product [Lampetra planeri]
MGLEVSAGAQALSEILANAGGRAFQSSPASVLGLAKRPSPPVAPRASPRVALRACHAGPSGGARGGGIVTGRTGREAGGRREAAVESHLGIVFAVTFSERGSSGGGTGAQQSP